MLSVSELNVILISAVSFTLLRKRQEQTSTECPCLLVSAHTGRMYLNSTKLLPYTHNWGSFQREMRCHPYF